MVTFVLEYGHERGIKIQNDEWRMLGFVVQLCDGLLQEGAVKKTKRVVTFDALLE